MYGQKIHNTKFYGDEYRWFIGVVVEGFGSDPAQLGRVKVRIAGVHDGEQIQNGDLPWATVVASTNTSGGLNGHVVPRLQPGAQVVGFFADGKNSQQPVVTAAVPYIADPTAIQAINQRYTQQFQQPEELIGDLGDVAPAPAAAVANGRGFEWLPGVDPRIVPDLVNKLERISARTGKLLRLNSGYRDPVRNSRVGGAKGSQHLYGRAIDMLTSGYSREEVLQLVSTASAEGITGIGIYKSSLHFDIRPAGRAGWGPSFSRNSVFPWARTVFDNHVNGRY